MNADARSASELVADHVERLLIGDMDTCGEDANRILDRIHRGEKIEVLRPLLSAGVVECTRSLTFILSEMGLRSIEAMNWLSVLLDYPDEYVRHYAIVAVQHSGSLEDGEITATAISKLDDARPVSLAALRFMATGSIRQIATAVPFLDGDLGEAVAWLVGEDYSEWQQVGSHSSVVTLVTVAAAARSRVDGDAVPLERLMKDDSMQVADAARFVATSQPLTEQGRDILYRIAEPPVDGRAHGE